MVNATGMKYQISNICCLEYNCILSLKARRVKMHILLSRAGDIENAAVVKEQEGVSGSSLFSIGPLWTVPSRVNGG